MFIDFRCRKNYPEGLLKHRFLDLVLCSRIWFWGSGWSFIVYFSNHAFVCAQSCLILFNPMDCSLPGSTVHGILQAKDTGSRLPWLPPGNFLNPGIEPASPVELALQADSLLLSHQGSPLWVFDTLTKHKHLEFAWITKNLQWENRMYFYVS